MQLTLRIPAIVVALAIVPALLSAQNPAPPGKLVMKRDADTTIENFWQLTPRIYSGGEPVGEAAFKRLADLGIKTVVSVDGAKPNLDLARRYGLRYIHIPIGYDGVPRSAELQLTRLARDVDGPLFIHCHHGQHRGPAAAAVACVADGAVASADASTILKQIGTSKDYSGLWRDVAQFELPGKDEQLPPLVETASVNSFPAAMAKVDRHWDDLKLCREAEWKTPAKHPDLVPKQQALLLYEQLHESRRHLTADHPAEFRTWLAASEASAQALEASLRGGDHAAAEKQYQTLAKSCKQCHAKYRDQ
ncbi:MAG TPA: cytochrome c [Pirellulaceae bacterium]|nr:cytochrome c [Pirellulaceae bacterium]